MVKLAAALDAFLPANGVDPTKVEIRITVPNVVDMSRISDAVKQELGTAGAPPLERFDVKGIRFELIVRR
jgi:hypothetical protein